MSGPAIFITDHAVQRWQERVDPRAGRAEIAAILSCRAVVVAAEFGARVVRIGRHRVILELRPGGAAVITVILFNDHLPRALLPAQRGGEMPVAHLRALFAHDQGA